MCKITRISQLGDVNALYRVSGIFDKSEICFITRVGRRICFTALLLPIEERQIIKEEFYLACDMLSGMVSIMCLQRG